MDAKVPFAEAVRVLMEEVERASHELQCEISLLFLPEALEKHQPVLEHLGYQARSIPALGVRAWQEAAAESMVPGTILLFKQLRQDRVLRPV
jgi:dephospho-CoA kinase